jgi:hypothetical protein
MPARLGTAVHLLGVIIRVESLFDVRSQGAEGRPGNSGPNGLIQTNSAFACSQMLARRV